MQCEDYVTPEAVLALNSEQLRGVGLSYAKVIAELLQHKAVLSMSSRCLVREHMHDNQKVVIHKY